MALEHDPDHISVAVNYMPDDHITVADLIWGDDFINAPHTSYTSDISKRTSIAFNRYFPVHPVRVQRLDEALQSPEEVQRGLNVLTACFGGEFKENLVRAPEIGMFAMSLSLAKNHRLALARIQLESPSTPSALRSGVRAMLASIERGL
jgi:hypothetical protein